MHFKGVEMKYIVRTKDEQLRLVDYWVIDEKEEQQAIAKECMDVLMAAVKLVWKF